MKKKLNVRKIISLGILTFGIGAAGVPVVSSSDVIAAEPVITQEDLNIKKAELERAQSEYDEALERAQAEYDEALEKQQAARIMTMAADFIQLR